MCKKQEVYLKLDEEIKWRELDVINSVWHGIPGSLHKGNTILYIFVKIFREIKIHWCMTLSWYIKNIYMNQKISKQKLSHKIHILF